MKLIFLILRNFTIFSLLSAFPTLTQCWWRVSSSPINQNKTRIEPRPPTTQECIVIPPTTNNMLFGVPDSDLKPIRSRSDTQKKNSALDGFESRFLTYIKDYSPEIFTINGWMHHHIKRGKGVMTHAITRISYNPPI